MNPTPERIPPARTRQMLLVQQAWIHLNNISQQIDLLLRRLPGAPAAPDPLAREAH